MNINVLPLISWDFHAISFEKICRKFKDIELLNGLSKINKWSSDQERINRESLEKEYVIVVTDAQLKIVHATHNIIDMTGYKSGELLGKRPQMFQGEGTSKATTKYIRGAIRNSVPFEATLLNYKKDGTPYNCLIKGKPIFNLSGKLVNFIAFERKVA